MRSFVKFIVNLFIIALLGIMFSLMFSPREAFAGYDENEVTTVSGTKVWNDNDDADGIRPSYIYISLYADGTFVKSTTVNAATGWSYAFYELPLYGEDGVTPISYTVSEDEVPSGYTVSYNGYTIVNTHTPEEHEPEYVSVSGTKTWVDENDQDGIRPRSITISLFANGVEIDSQLVTAESGWSYSFGNLLKVDDNGMAIRYTIAEAPVSGYTTVVDGYDVINTHVPEHEDEPEYTTLSGVKTWNDNNDVDGIRPDSIMISLLANGEDTGMSKLVSNATAWTYTFTNLPKVDADGKVINYTVRENFVAGYEVSYVKTMRGFDIVNSHITEEHKHEYTTVSGTKTWNDNNNQDGIRPENIMVNLIANGNDTGMSKLVSASTDWAYSFTNLPKVDEDGREIVYSVREDAVEGYEATYDGWNITNTHVPTTTPEQPEQPTNPEPEQPEEPSVPEQTTTTTTTTTPAPVPSIPSRALPATGDPFAVAGVGGVALTGVGMIVARIRRRFV